jgi:hypothetical protein
MTTESKKEEERVDLQKLYMETHRKIIIQLEQPQPIIGK